MANIVNFKENLSDRPSNVIFEMLNRFHEGKKSGSLRPDELSRIIVLSGDLYANKVSKGEVSISDIEETENFVSCFTEPNYDKYFNLAHTDLDKASKMFMDGVFFAQEKQSQRSKYSNPLFDAQTYESGFKKL